MKVPLGFQLSENSDVIGRICSIRFQILLLRLKISNKALCKSYEKSRLNFLRIKDLSFATCFTCIFSSVFQRKCFNRLFCLFELDFSLLSIVISVMIFSIFDL